MQKKKIEEVETWLKMHIFQRQPKQVILLKLAGRSIKLSKQIRLNSTLILEETSKQKTQKKQKSKQDTRQPFAFYEVVLLHYRKSLKVID